MGVSPASASELIAEEVVYQTDTFTQINTPTNYKWALRQSQDNHDEHDNLPHDDHEDGEEWMLDNDFNDTNVGT